METRRLSAMDLQAASLDIERQFDIDSDTHVPLYEDEQFQDWTARRIQAWFRGQKIRRQYELTRRSVIYIQRFYRKLLKKWRERPDLDLAARKIQGCWTRYYYRKIFLYYKALIDFRQRGTPATLLRSINPSEAQLAEAASGLHVRFRLGGSTFPPLIFYKIYTHRPVTDIGSFAPRDYVYESQKKESKHNRKPANPTKHVAEDEDFAIPEELLACYHPGARRGGTAGGGMLRTRAQFGWYRRTDANGWRPISESLFHEEDRVERYTAARQMDFSHVRTVRKEDLEKKRRQKKLAWLQRMYGVGGAAAGAGSEEAEHGVTGDASASTAPASASEALSPPVVVMSGEGEESEGIDALIGWSQNLDFDQYVNDWLTQSCSNGSESIVPLPIRELGTRADMVESLAHAQAASLGSASQSSPGASAGAWGGREGSQSKAR